MIRKPLQCIDFTGSDQGEFSLYKYNKKIKDLINDNR